MESEVFDPSKSTLKSSKNRPLGKLSAPPCPVPVELENRNPGVAQHRLHDLPTTPRRSCKDPVS